MVYEVYRQFQKTVLVRGLLESLVCLSLKPKAGAEMPPDWRTMQYPGFGVHIVRWAISVASVGWSGWLPGKREKLYYRCHLHFLYQSFHHRLLQKIYRQHLDHQSLLTNLDQGRILGSVRVLCCHHLDYSACKYIEVGLIIHSLHTISNREK